MNIKKPVTLVLLLLHFALIGAFIYENKQEMQNLSNTYSVVFDSYAKTLETEYKLYKLYEMKNVEIYINASKLNADLYNSCHFSLTKSKECYEKEIKYNNLIIDLKENYGYRGGIYSTFELKRQNEEFKYLIENNMEYQYDQRIDVIHYAINYYEECFFVMVGIIALILSCFSISNNFESGNFKTFASLPLSRSKMIIGKICGLFLTVLIIIYVPIIICSIGVLLMDGFGNINYPYVIYINKSFKVISEINVYILYLICSFIISFFITISGFVFSYLLKDGILSLLATILFIYFPNILFNNIESISEFSHLIYSSYINVYDVLNGNLSILTNNHNFNLILGMSYLVLLSMLLLVTILIDYRKKDIYY